MSFLNRVGIVMSLWITGVCSAGPIESLEVHRQFDFWAGEWDVTNRFWAADRGEAVVPGAALRVYPILNGGALVEHYRGANWGGNDIFGFSVRAYDPAKEQWVILLNWPSGNARFWTMEGGFEFNRGLFYGERQGQDGETITDRYIFSDLIPGFYRWEGSQSTDNGATWNRPGYVMEGIRRADDAEQIDTAWLHGDPITDRCEGEQRRELDFMQGQWEGRTRFRDAGGAWSEHDCRIESRAILANCARMNLYEHDLPDEDEPYGAFTVLAYDADREAWVSYFINNDGPSAGVMHRYEGNMQENEFSMSRELDSGGIERFRWHDIQPDSYRWERARSTDGGESWAVDVTTELERVQ